MMKRILCLIDTLGPGGAQRQLVGLSTFLKERGYEVTLAAYYDNPFYEGQLLTAGVRYEIVHKAQKGLFRQWHLMRFIRRLHPDVVVSYLESPSIRASVARMFEPFFKLIVSERNTTQHTGRNEKLRFNLFRLADYVVPNSFTQADYIRKTFPVLSDKVVTIPNFVDLVHFTPPSQRRRREIPEVIVVATIWPSKNTLGFLDAVAKLKGLGRKVHFSWYGKDAAHMDYFNQCQEKIERHCLGDYIELKEKTAAIKERYQESDYFCLPSFYEGTPNALCEAMACGLPVACSDVCDNGRYVQKGGNGFLFNPEDPDTMASALVRLLSLDEDDYQSYCRRSRERAERMLSKDRFVESYLTLIEQ